MQKVCVCNGIACGVCVGGGRGGEGHCLKNNI